MALVTVSNNSLTAVTALPASIPTGALTLIKSITASSSASISFVDGTDGVVLDDTYKSYVFKFIDIHPQNDTPHFTFQASINGGSSYGVTATTTFFDSAHAEADNNQGLNYQTGFDQAQSTNFINITREQGNGNDESVVGTLQIFNPSSNTFVKHWIARTQHYYYGNLSFDVYTAGYFNDGANDIDAVQFKFSSGNIDDGIIKLYGVK